MSTFGGMDALTGYAPSSPSSSTSEEGLEKAKTKRQAENLMHLTKENINLKFKDQYDEPFARIFVKDHHEIISTRSTKFAKFLYSKYFEEYQSPVGAEAVNNVINTLQGQAQFGDLQYSLSLRVTEYDGDIYYDLTNAKHQCIRISKKDTKWDLLDRTPIPLFKRYNQKPQDIPAYHLHKNIKEDNKEKESKDLLEVFFSNLTNIKDADTKLLAKVALLSYFIPNVPHIILIIHGGKGSAKSTFQLLLKSIIDPAKPTLLTLHEKPSEFTQQLSQNYLATFDNIRFVPKWLPDETCRAATGIGQTKRALYTDDDVKVYEYKHCLMFNGINIAFSEADVIDRSIVIELAEIDDENRKTEEDILNEFKALKPRLMAFIFDTLAKAAVIKKDIEIKRLPRMADFAIWGEAIARSLGYKENEFIKAYYNNIGFQNGEVVDSSPLGFAIKRFIERLCSDDDTLNNKTFFEGPPLKLLVELNRIANEEGIDTNQRDWPKNRNWLIKRINILKSNLQKVIGIKISIERDSKTNTSTIKIEKNDSGNSGEHKMTPENESLSPYLNGLSPVLGKVSPEENQDLSTKSNDSGDTGVTGDKFDIVAEEEDENKKDIEETQSSGTDQTIGFKKPVFYCKQHHHVQNIHREEIERHMLYSKDHGQQSP